MPNVQNILCVIPARAGSKRLPNKNKLNLGGKPLISWTIELAKKLFPTEHIIVSTDDTDIAKLAASLNVAVPWMRPTALAGDHASSTDVVLHALSWYENAIAKVDAVILLQPTSPFRKLETVRAGIKVFTSLSNTAVISVSKIDCHPSRMFTIVNDRLKFQDPSANFDTPSQQLQDIYAPNGLLYLIGAKEFKASRSFFSNFITPVIVEDQIEALDIDTQSDFDLADKISRLMT